MTKCFSSGCAQAEFGRFDDSLSQTSTERGGDIHRANTKYLCESEMHHVPVAQTTLNRKSTENDSTTEEASEITTHR